MQEKTQKISPIKERILYFIETLNISKREFYRITGISRGTLEANTGITEDIMAKFFANYPEVSEKWVLFSEGNMLKSDAEVAVRGKKYPLLPMGAVAGWSGIEEQGAMMRDCQWIELPEFIDFTADFFIRANGDSMLPTYRSGDILACKSIREMNFFQWGKVYVIDSSQGVMVKRLEQDDDQECVLCVSDNERFRPFRLQKNEIRNIALVVGLIRAE